MISTDSRENRIVYLIIGVISIFCAYGLSLILEIIQFNLWYIEIPSVWGFYILILELYSKHIWKLKIGRIRFSNNPNLNGYWKGIIKSSFKGIENSNKLPKEIPFEAQIFQSWNELCIFVKTSFSKSKSKQCFFDFSSPDGTYLTYIYTSEPKSDSPTTMQVHTGVNELLISRDNMSMEGDYFNGRGRETYGTITFQKVLTE